MEPDQVERLISSYNLSLHSDMRRAIREPFLARLGETSLPVGGTLVCILDSGTIAGLILGLRSGDRAEDWRGLSNDRWTTWDSVAAVVREVAAPHGHVEVTSVHFIAALVRIDAGSCDLALDTFRRRYAEKHPRGTTRQQNILDFARRMNRPEWVRDMEARIKGQPYKLTDVISEFDAYLGSPYYPFTESQLMRFRTEEPEREADSRTLGWFTAHAVIAEKCGD